VIALESGFDEAPFNGGQPYGSTPTDPFCQPLPVVGPAHYRLSVEIEFPESDIFCHCAKCRAQNEEFLSVMISEKILGFFRNVAPYTGMREEIGVSVDPVKGGAK